jgi:hypothetical protein
MRQRIADGVPPRNKQTIDVQGRGVVKISEALPDGVSEVVLVGGTPLNGNSGVVANAAAAATLTPAAGKTAYLTSVTFCVGGATAGLLVGPTITGLAGGTKTFVVAVPAGVLLANVYTISFNYPLPASGPSVNIVASLPACGAGNTASATDITGFQT